MTASSASSMAARCRSGRIGADGSLPAELVLALKQAQRERSTPGRRARRRADRRRVALALEGGNRRRRSFAASRGTGTTPVRRHSRMRSSCDRKVRRTRRRPDAIGGRLFVPGARDRGGGARAPRRPDARRMGLAEISAMAARPRLDRRGRERRHRAGAGGDARHPPPRRSRAVTWSSSTRTGSPAPDDALPLLARASAALAALPPGTVKSAVYSDGHWTFDLGRVDAGAGAARLDARMRAGGIPALVATSAAGTRIRVGAP